MQHPMLHLSQLHFISRCAFIHFEIAFGIWNRIGKRWRQSQPGSTTIIKHCQGNRGQTQHPYFGWSYQFHW